MRVIAVDWSGALIGSQQRIWLAEARIPGRLERLECGRTRAALTQHMLTDLCREPETVVGLDFAFSFPGWYLAQLGVASSHELWQRAAQDGEQWLAECASPFWGRGRRARPVLDGSHFRATELEVVRQTGMRPKSIFQVGGAGSVGTGSIRGMPLLLALHAAGAHIWPFDPPGWPVVLEIYPRLLTGPVVKSNAVARAAALERFPLLAPADRESAIGSEDAFDAAVSALVMIEHAAEFEALTGDGTQEGRIWRPAPQVGDTR